MSFFSESVNAYQQDAQVQATDIKTPLRPTPKSSIFGKILHLESLRKWPHDLATLGIRVIAFSELIQDAQATPQVTNLESLDTITPDHLYRFSSKIIKLSLVVGAIVLLDYFAIAVSRNSQEAYRNRIERPEEYIGYPEV